MKVLILTALSIFTLQTFAAESLEYRAAKECKQFAINHALKKEKASWGEEVSLLHVDRSIPTGVLEGSKGELEGYANIEVTLSRESIDPVVYEMVVAATQKKGAKSLTCKIKKEVTRDLL